MTTLIAAAWLIAASLATTAGHDATAALALLAEPGDGTPDIALA